MVRRVRTVAQLAFRPVARAGGLTGWLVERYCSGRGVEVGPGAAPYAPHAVLVDRLSDHHGRAIRMDVMGDAASLPFRSEALDFVLSAHCLEHHHDVGTVLDEWRRVLVPGGRLVLILPHVDRTFDRGRPVANAAHHLAERGTPLDPDDPPHWVEYESVSLRGAPDDPAAWRPDGSWNRRWFVENAHIHYHAWTQHEMVQLVTALGFRLLTAIEELPDRSDSFAVVARRF